MSHSETSGCLSPEQRERAVDVLSESRDRLLSCVAGFTDAQWDFKPQPDAWSAADCAEHVTVTGNRIFQRVMGLMSAEPVPAMGEQASGKDELILKGILNRSNKFQAPEPVRPSNQWADRPILIEQFQQTFTRVIDFVSATQDNLLDRCAPHPVPGIGILNAYQWILAIAGHTQRHILQIEELKHNPEFPK